MAKKSHTYGLFMAIRRPPEEATRRGYKRRPRGATRSGHEKKAARRGEKRAMRKGKAIKQKKRAVRVGRRGGLRRLGEFRCSGGSAAFSQALALTLAKQHATAQTSGRRGMAVRGMPFNQQAVDHVLHYSGMRDPPATCARLAGGRLAMPGLWKPQLPPLKDMQQPTLLHNEVQAGRLDLPPGAATTTTPTSRSATRDLASCPSQRLDPSGLEPCRNIGVIRCALCHVSVFWCSGALAFGDVDSKELVGIVVVCTYFYFYYHYHHNAQRWVGAAADNRNMTRGERACIAHVR